MQIFGFLITVEWLIGKRMMLADKFMQPFLKHMRIDLRGRNIGMAQQLLGHADISTTQIYTHVLEERLHKLVSEHHPLAD